MAMGSLLERMEVVAGGGGGGDGEGECGKDVSGVDGGEGRGREEGEEKAKVEFEGKGKGRKWPDVYHSAFSSALTDIVQKLQETERVTEESFGEVGWAVDGL